MEDVEEIAREIASHCLQKIASRVARTPLIPAPPTSLRRLTRLLFWQALPAGADRIINSGGAAGHFESVYARRSDRIRDCVL